MKIIDLPQYGPMFRFTDASVYLALHTLSDGRRVGRKRLAELIGIGEGSMRRILNTLKDWGMIQIKQTGISITKIGIDFLEELPLRLVSIDVGSLVLGNHTQAVLVKGVADKIGNGLRQRDVGIRMGALGCTTLVMTDDRIILPLDWSVDDNNPEVAKQIRSLNLMNNGDALVIGGADDRFVAINAALMASFDLF